MLKFDAAIFDLDGTLLDSVGIWEQIDREFLGSYGLPVPEDYMASVMSMTFRQTAEYTIRRFSLPDSPEAIMERWRCMAAYAYAHTVSLKPGAKELLCLLKQQGIHMAVATASSRELFLPCLQNNGILSFFDALTSTDEVKKGKESPDVYLLAAEKLQAAPERCVVFEDVYPCAVSARMAGMTVFGVYDSHADSEKERMRCFCDRYCLSLEELTDSPSWLFFQEEGANAVQHIV